MSFIGDILGSLASPFLDPILDIGGDILGDVTGSTAAKAAEAGALAQQTAAEKAIAAQQEASVRGQEFLAPFGQIGTDALSQAGFLTDPQAQFEFLQQNPLFQLSLDEARRGTQQTAAAGGRLSAGDTLQQLSKNVLLSAQPLIGQQKKSIAGLLDFGRGVAGAQANVAIGEGSQISPLLQDIGNIQAAGGIGAANARSAGTQNLISTGITAGLLFSDSRLKTNIKSKGRKKDLDWFSWTWNALAKQLFGLEGRSEGVIAQKIMKSHPGSVIMDRGYLKVNYTVLGL